MGGTDKVEAGLLVLMQSWMDCEEECFYIRVDGRKRSTLTVKAFVPAQSLEVNMQMESAKLTRSLRQGGFDENNGRLRKESLVGQQPHADDMKKCICNCYTQGMAKS